MKKINAKQEKFARLVFEGVDISEAGSQCWDWSRYSGNAKRVEANKKLNHEGTAARIAELRAEAACNSQVTVESLLVELEEARQVAKTEAQPAAMVSASIGKAKLTGLDKQIIEVSGKNGKPIETVTMTKEEYKAAREEALKDDDC